MYKIYYITVLVLLIECFITNNAFAQTKENDIWQNKLSEYTNNKDVQSLIFVKGLNSSSTAKLEMYKKDENNNFKQLFKIDAIIGKNGLGKEKEGDYKTPIGDFGIIQVFGIKPNPGTTLEYLLINENHYACDDNCEYYNKIIDAKALKHDCKGEHIIKYIPQYNYGLAIDYNKECVYPKGSAIFMHCKGKKPFTAGCIAMAEENMIKVLKEIDTNTRICIFAF